MNHLLDTALGAICLYLEEQGWTLDDNFTSTTFLFYIDPKTASIHRSDFAFIIQTERALNKKLDL